MTDRDRLIELIKGGSQYLCEQDNLVKRIADYLLANGVIVPPCKVGDKTFLLLEKISGGYDIVESECVCIAKNKYSIVYSMAIDCTEIGNTLEFHLNDFGRWVFLTKEEAEAELRKRSEDNA